MIRFLCCRHCNGHGLYIDWNDHLGPCRAYWDCHEGRQSVVKVGAA